MEDLCLILIVALAYLFGFFKTMEKKASLLEKKLDGITAYVRLNHKRQEPGVPEDAFTRKWMHDHGVEYQDAEAMVYKYLEKAFENDGAVPRRPTTPFQEPKL